MAGRLTIPDGSAAVVRMYRVGPGDCFLLAFPGTGGSPAYALVDCGIHHKASRQAETMGAVARDIHEATGGRLDLVLPTHEHTDHVLGFTLARQVFDTIEVGAVWMGWIEDEHDDAAAEFRRRRSLLETALHAAVTRLRACGAGGAADRVEASLGLAVGPGVWDYLRGKAGPPAYLEPGGCVPVPGSAGVKAYVLGPPHAKELLHKTDPGSGEGYRELLEGAGLSSLAAALLGLGDGRAGGASRALEPILPFDARYRVSYPLAGKTEFFRTYYGFGPGRAAGPEWRRIEADWLMPADELALKLGELTNNTSLAVAFSLPGSGGVLLFPGDAQIGNWLSWQGLQWHQGSATVKTADLLRRTVVYKVGHHGSHNATLRPGGLEEMTDPSLVAMIPVDQTFANDQGWEHPAEGVLRALKAKTRGRVLRADVALPDGKPARLTSPEWHAFRKRVTRTDLYVDYCVPADDQPP
jgi:beta-lactamase superfamily II metal-dependent hydrolase